MIIRTHYAADNRTILSQKNHPDSEFEPLSIWFGLAENPAVRITIDRLDGTSVTFTHTAD